MWKFIFDSKVFVRNRTPVESEIQVHNDVDSVYAEPGPCRIGGVLAPEGPDVGSPVHFPIDLAPSGPNVGAIDRCGGSFLTQWFS